MLNFCTYFDKNYLFKGLALYNSLINNCKEFRLWILCFDDTTYSIIGKMNLKNVNLISLSDFEDPELLKAKPTRSKIEYCWTCTPSLPLYILRKNPELDTITYLDADLYFYSDPAILYEEFGNKSIFITEHFYTAKYRKYEEMYGKYNVQFLIFRNDNNALKCLEWWRERCNEWCYLKQEDGKLGDQKYLDDWPERFNGVHVLKNKGAGVAPWNIQNYKVERKDDGVFIDDFRLIFYHFHQLNIITSQKYDLIRGYILPNKCINYIYKPYVEALNEVIGTVKKYEPAFNCGYNLGRFVRCSSFKDIIRNAVYLFKPIEFLIRKYIGKFIGMQYYVYEIK